MFLSKTSRTSKVHLGRVEGADIFLPWWSVYVVILILFRAYIERVHQLVEHNLIETATNNNPCSLYLQLIPKPDLKKILYNLNLYFLSISTFSDPINLTFLQSVVHSAVNK